MEGTLKTEQHLANLLKAKFPIIYIESWEENRVIDMITNICHNKQLIKSDRVVYVWSMTTGLVNADTNNNTQDYADVDMALNYFNNEVEEDDKAIEDYTKAIELKPDNANYYSDRADCYKNSHQYDKAREDLDKASLITKVEEYYQKAESASFIDKFEDAIDVSNWYRILSKKLFAFLSF